MFGDNIIPDDMLDGFYDKTDTSNNTVDVSNNIVDVSNNTVYVDNSFKNIDNKTVLCYGGDDYYDPFHFYIIRPIDKDGDMIRNFGRR